MENHELKFVASMTVCPSDIRKIQKHIPLSKTSLDPLKQVLITPLFVSPDSVQITKEMSEEGTSVFFDSGGYYVQMGRLKYEELYMPLMETYRTHQWADVYTLPDHVPTSQDTPERIAQKVRDTITFSTLFFQEMPDELKDRAMPVVQGHNYAQVDECLTAYLNLGVKRIGFGSFGTIGKNNEVNIATQNAIEMARYIIQVAHQHGIKVHIFGLGVPALVAMLKGIGADSFDSSSWLKSAGFGQVFLPFMRAYNVSYKYTDSEFQLGATKEQFDAMCELTMHRCGLCESIAELGTKKMYRAVHNLVVMAETVKAVNEGEFERIKTIYENGSSRYKGEFAKWLTK